MPEKPIDVTWLQEKSKGFSSAGHERAAKVVYDFIRSKIRSVPTP